MATIQGRNYSTLLRKVDIQVASFVLRPCDHLACVTCFGQAMMNDMKVSVSTCDKVVKAFVFKKPASKVSVGARSAG